MYIHPKMRKNVIKTPVSEVYIMKRKNILTFPAVLAAVLLAGCGSGNNDKETESSRPSEISSVSVSESTVSAAESDMSETSPDTESSTVTDNTEDEDTESSADTETVNPLADYTAAAIAVGEWPEMREVTDEQILSDYFLLDKNNENYRNLIVMQCPVSANMSEIIIIEADDSQAASDDLKERLKKAQDVDAFYPDDVEKAKNAIVGTTGDYAYYILGAEPEVSEEALLMKIE